MAHFKAQHMPYRKTGTEWEILGDLAARLHHKEEAKDAYQVRHRSNYTRTSISNPPTALS